MWFIICMRAAKLEFRKKLTENEGDKQQNPPKTALNLDFISLAVFLSKWKNLMIARISFLSIIENTQRYLI